MHHFKFEKKKPITWSNASEDYANHRPGPPQSFFLKLQHQGVGLPCQNILDLGTGTGHLARQFARQGARVAGIDESTGQITQAIKLAEYEGVKVDFRHATAENTPFESESFDIITANQCWVYFDLEKTLNEVRRLLRPGGILVTSHFSYLAIKDPIAHMSEELIKKYNPTWSWNWDGRVPEVPDWSKGLCEVRKMFVYDEHIPFTEEGWRGRMRAHRAIGAELSRKEKEAFDLDLKERLQEYTAPYNVLHRIDAHLFDVHG